jgi:hypothetical protein
VREQDETLQLQEVDESIQDDAVSIEDERPPNLVNLLKDQELYEENPALEMFEPPPAFPSQQPRGGQPGAPAAPQQPQPAQIAQPAQLTLSPQGESVLANSLKESVAAQSKVVEKLFDEMKELSRKIDERKSPGPVPPIILNMQAGAGESPRRPTQMDFPSSGPQPEGFPRYASSDMDEPDEQVPGSDNAPTERSSTDFDTGSQPTEGRTPGEEPDVTLEEVPEDLEPLTEELASPEERAPAPAGWPGMEPITDAEPEPEIETAVEETPGRAGAAGACGRRGRRPQRHAVECVVRLGRRQAADCGCGRGSARRHGDVRIPRPARVPAGWSCPLERRRAQGASQLPQRRSRPPGQGRRTLKPGRSS